MTYNIVLVSSHPNSAFNFDGTDDYVSVTYSPDFQISTYTISAWVNPTADLTSDFRAIVTRGEDITTDHAAMYLGVAPTTFPQASGAFMFYEDNGDNDHYFDTGHFPQAGAWTHITATIAATGAARYGVHS